MNGRRDACNGPCCYGEPFMRVEWKKEDNVTNEEKVKKYGEFASLMKVEGKRPLGLAMLDSKAGCRAHMGSRPNCRVWDCGFHAAFSSAATLEDVAKLHEEHCQQKKEKPKMTRLERAARDLRIAALGKPCAPEMRALLTAIDELDARSFVLVEQSKEVADALKSQPNGDYMTATECILKEETARRAHEIPAKEMEKLVRELKATPSFLDDDDIISEECVRSRPKLELTEEQKRMGLRSRRFVDCPEWNEDYD